MAVVLSACVSLSYVDSDHVQHTIGLVDVAVPLQGESAGGRRTTASTVTTVGIAIYRGTASDGGVTVGYNRQAVVSLANGACLDLELGGPCARDAQGRANHRAINQ